MQLINVKDLKKGDSVVFKDSVCVVQKVAVIEPNVYVAWRVGPSSGEANTKFSTNDTVYVSESV